MRTFSITTLGCKVNQYESDQIASLLSSRGLLRVETGGDLRVINTCSVTIAAAGKSRQAIRREAKADAGKSAFQSAPKSATTAFSLPVLASAARPSSILTTEHPPEHPLQPSDAATRPRVIVTGCWATSDPEAASKLSGVDAVLGHHDDVGPELHRILDRFTNRSVADQITTDQITTDEIATDEITLPSPPEPIRNDEWMNDKAGTLASDLKVEVTGDNKSFSPREVNRNLAGIHGGRSGGKSVKSGTISLPQLGARQSGHQRAFLKIQDGCDAHCTYCIIPQLRPRLWSKPADDAVAEAQRLVDAGHLEIVLTGIFLGAYGQPTALRRRQDDPTGKPLGELIEALCTRVRGLKRVRLSSLEPGDLSEELLTVLAGHPQVAPHFHLPLQSGSDALLHRMNRQYTRDDFLRMLDSVQDRFDRPAFTTDIIVGFPGETDAEFARTLDVVDRVGFIHVHAFSYSPRPRTAAARWTRDFVPGPVVNERIESLRRRAIEHSFAFRQQFVGETVELLVERPSAEERDVPAMAGFQHGRCQRYFAVHFATDRSRVGDLVKARIDRVTSHRTICTLI